MCAEIFSLFRISIAAILNIRTIRRIDKLYKEIERSNRDKPFLELESRDFRLISDEYIGDNLN